MIWSSQFHIQHRVAKRMRHGNFLLAGDAAHVHSPAGGQGMNTGIQDAISLAAALEETLRTGDNRVLSGDGSKLDRWQNQRLDIARSVVAFTDRMTRMATASSPIVKRLRNVLVELVGSIPLAEHALAEKLAELSHNSGITTRKL